MNQKDSQSNRQYKKSGQTNFILAKNLFAKSTTNDHKRK